MALVERYFSTTAAGAGDGTSWANRAALFSAGNWSTVITGFNFSGSDGLRCHIEGGLSYTCGQSLAAALFANAPSVANSLFLHGCDGSGNLLEPPDPDWTCDLPAFSDASLPTIATTTNVATINLNHCIPRLIKLTGSGRNGAVLGTAMNALVDWCIVLNSTSNTAAHALASSGGLVTNTVLQCSGTSYLVVWTESGTLFGSNVRVVGNSSASSGNRDGIAHNNTGTNLDGVAIINNPGRGIAYTGTATAPIWKMKRMVIVGNGGDGVQFPNTASQSSRQHIDLSIITGNGGYGINPGGANTHLVVTNTRLRDNTSGNYGTWGNYPQDLGNYVTDSDDATEYVNTGAGNYQIKSGATIHGKGFGVSEQEAAGGGIQQGLHSIEAGVAA